MRNVIKEEMREARGVLGRIKRRDLKGDSGQAIKNSSYELAQNLIFKIGSLIFTIIIARMLMPEKMGLYSLALATIILFSTFSDMGIASALITFVSKLLGKKDPSKAKGYIKKLFKWKLYLSLITSLALLSSAYFISNTYYNKPIFYALLVGGLYLSLISFLGFFEQLFKAANDFKTPMMKEILFQVARFILVPLASLLLLKSSFSDGTIVAFVLLTSTFCYFIAMLFLLFLAKKKLKFLKVPSENLTISETKNLKKFIIPLSAMALSGAFFGYIDILMLGHYVSSQFIAYYGIAFALIGSATAIMGFTAVALMPIFSKLKGAPLERLFKKTRNFTLTISLLAGIFTYVIAWWAIRIIYGTDYLSAVPVLKMFSILVVILPTSALYLNYYISQKRTSTIAGILIGSAILNIVFNLVGITYGLANYGEMGAISGAVLATILSRSLYLGGLVLWRKPPKKLT